MYGHPRAHIIRKQISNLDAQIHSPPLTAKYKCLLGVGKELDSVNQKHASIKMRAGSEFRMNESSNLASNN